MKVLVLDDNALVRRFFCHCFRGEDVVEASTLEEAHTATLTNTFDLVICDLVLPDSDPINTVQKMRAWVMDGVLIAVSGYEIEDSIKNFVDDFYHKTELPGCQVLRDRILETIKAVKELPAYHAPIKAIQAWSVRYGGITA